MTPDHWQRRKARDFGVRSKVINIEGKELPPLSITKDRGVILQSEKYKKQIATDLSKYVVARRDQFAFDPMSLYYGAIGRVTPEVGLVSPDYVVFDVDSSVDKTFMNYVFRWPEQVTLYEAVAEAGNQFGKRRRVYWSVFENLDFNLPPPKEQRKISAILSAVDDAIEGARAVIDQLQVVKKAMMGDLLTRGLPGRHMRFKHTVIGQMPESWHAVKIGDLAMVGNGSTPSRQRLDYWNGGTIPWLPTGKVNDRNICVAEQFVTRRALDECPIRLLPPGTLLVAMIGQGRTRGMVAHLSIEATINQNFAFITSGKSIRSWFLFGCLEHKYEELRGSAHGSNQGALNCSIIKGFQVPVPPVEEQHQIESARLLIEQRIDAEQSRVDALAGMKSALMSALLTGELRVTPDEATP